jgi:DNA-directed RNA polymerase subunit RPC12/RpoP
MGFYCGRCSSLVLNHLAREDRRDDEASLIATADHYQCAECGARGTYYVYADGTILLTDCLGARGHV